GNVDPLRYNNSPNTLLKVLSCYVSRCGKGKCLFPKLLPESAPQSGNFVIRLEGGIEPNRRLDRLKREICLIEVREDRTQMPSNRRVLRHAPYSILEERQCRLVVAEEMVHPGQCVTGQR